MARLLQSVAYTRMFLIVQSADHITGLTGASVSVTLSKAGAAFAAAAGAVTEVGNGWYKLAATAVDTGTLGDLAYHCTAASGGDPTDFVDQIVAVPNLTKNQPLAAFQFLMTDSTLHAPKTGLTVTAQRSLDGGGFAACANSVVEVGNGWYKIDLAAADLNGNSVALRFSATSADDQDITLITQP